MEIVPPPPKEPASRLLRFLCPHEHSEYAEQDGVVYMRWVCGDCGSTERFYERPRPRDALVRHIMFQQVKRALPKAVYAVSVAALIAATLSLMGTRFQGG